MSGSTHDQRRDEPRADTTMMSVVHDALRRDMGRLHDALATATERVPSDARRLALCDHVEWMMNFLHRHHAGEDDGLWPLLLAHAPEAAPLLDRMQAEHRHLVAAMERVGTAVCDYRNDRAEQPRLAKAVDSLSEPLFAHLRREEDDVMPVVSANLTDREWQAWDKQYNIRGKSIKQLAMDGHWLMDQLDRQRYQTLVHLVPPPIRLLIVKGFARHYRQACATRWGPGVTVTPLPA